MAKKKNKYGLYVGAAVLSLAGALLLTNNHRVNSPDCVVNHYLPTHSSSNKQKITLQNTKEEVPVTREEEKQDLEIILSSAPFKRTDIENLSPVNSHSFVYISPESNAKLAKKLMHLGEDSIDHMFEYVKSSYVKAEKFRFHIPQRAEEIVSTKREGANIYIVSDVGTKIETKYLCKLKNGRKIYPVVDKNEPDAGQSNIKFRVRAKEKGFTIEAEENSPVFYNTSSEKVVMVETFAIEMLHRALRPYTKRHFGSEISDIPLDRAILNKSLVKWKDREETIVHAISTLWLTQYNKDRNLGLSDWELKQRFSWYDKHEIYGKVNTFALHIKDIGMQKAIERYAENPEKLFEN